MTPIGMNLELHQNSLQFPRFREGLYGASYHPEEGLFNASLTTDAVLTLALLSKMGYKVEANPPIS